MGCAPSKNNKNGTGTAVDSSGSGSPKPASPINGKPKETSSTVPDTNFQSVSDHEQHLRESDLSDISSMSEEELKTLERSGSRSNAALHQERSVVPSIEEDYFVYDDVVVSKSSDWIQKQRLIGRRPTFFGKKLTRESKFDGKFAFSDFCISVDEEVDSIPASVPPPEPPKPQVREFDAIRRFEVTTLLGHASRVKCIAIAPGEKEFVSCSNEDASVTLSNLRTGKEMGIFTGHTDTVINATFSCDGKYLATTSRDHTLILWDVVTAKQILTFDHSKVVICCCFSKDSKYIATGCQDKICRLWETKKGREALLFTQHEGIIICMSYAPDNSHIASASADKTLRVWSTTTGKAKYVLLGHVGIVLSCHFTADGKRIISNDEKLLKVWSMADGTQLLDIPVEAVAARTKGVPVPNKKLTWTLSCVAPGVFTRYLLVACNNRFVYVLDVETGEEIVSVFCKAAVYCLTTGFSNVAAFGDSFGNLYVARFA